MLNQISYNCASYLLQKNKIIKSEIPVYQYGFEIIITSLILLLSILTCVSVFFRLGDGIVFLLFFIPVRMFSGGYHAPSYLKCYFCTMFSCIGTIILAYLLPCTSIVLIVLLNLFFGGYIFKNAPLVHPNNPLSENKIIVNKRRARLFVIINSILICLAYFVDPFSSTLAIYTIALVAIMMYIPKNAKHVLAD